MKKTFSWAALCLPTLLLLNACNAQSTSAQTSSQGASASAAAAPADAERNIKAMIQQSYGDQGMKVLSIHETPVKNVYEVYLSGNQLVYMSGDGKYMFAGQMVDVAARKNLSEARLEDLNRIDYQSLPFDSAIKEVRGNGRLKVAVFSDPDCPYCKRLEHEFANMTDITIYNFMMPIPQLHPQAQAKAVQIWCSPNRTKAWTEWMRQGVTPSKVVNCANPVAQHMALGQQYGFNGTPTIVYPNGKVLSGYLPMPQLQEAIEANQK